MWESVVIFFRRQKGSVSKNVWETLMYIICVLGLQTIVRCVDVGVFWSRLRNCAEIEHRVSAQTLTWCIETDACWCDIRFNCMASSLPVLLAWVVDIEEFCIVYSRNIARAAHRRNTIVAQRQGRATHEEINFRWETWQQGRESKVMWKVRDQFYPRRLLFSIIYVFLQRIICGNGFILWPLTL
jgi:hypothetical protein